MRRFLAIVEFTTTDDDNDKYLLETCIRDAISNEGYIFSEVDFEMGRLGIKEIDSKKGGE